MKDTGNKVEDAILEGAHDVSMTFMTLFTSIGALFVGFVLLTIVSWMPDSWFGSLNISSFFLKCFKTNHSIQENMSYNGMARFRLFSI